MKSIRYLLASSLLIFPSFAVGSPPVEFPQACAPTFCVQVVATYPDQPGTFVTQHNAKTEAATMTVDMGRGFFVAFSSKYVESRLSHAPTENQWERRAHSAKAWTCLRCGATKGKDEVLGVALSGIPQSYGNDQFGLSVCVWPLDRSAAGYGDGKSMRLGDKVCIRSRAP